MQVIVGYSKYIEEPFEVDDKFLPLLEDETKWYDCFGNPTPLYKEFYEIINNFKYEVNGNIHHVLSEDGEITFAEW